MIIGIDGNEANQKIRVGVGQYAYNLLLELYRQKNSDQYYIFLKQAPLSDLPPESPNWHYYIFGPQKLWTKIALPFFLYFHSPKLDVFYSPGHYSPRFSPFKTVPTIHDIGYLNFQDQFTKKDLYQLINWTKNSIDQASQIVAVSEFTKNELIKTYAINPNKISLVFNGVNDISLPSKVFRRKTLAKFHLKSPYFISIGTLKPNKNYPFLINSFTKFLKKHPDYQLVIAGKKGWLYQEVDTLLRSQKITHQIIFTDYITEAEKWSLLSQATALIIPSTYEGFGIPAIEAQKLNIPVISSNIPSLKEVLSDSALYINPKKEDTLLLAMEKILNSTLRQKLIEKGQIQSRKFSWKKSAHDLRELLHQKFEGKNV